MVSGDQADQGAWMSRGVHAGRDANVAGRDLTVNYYGPRSTARPGEPDMVPAAEAFRLEEFPRAASASRVDPQQFGLSTLLRAADRVVPFIGRTAELSQLRSWRDAPGQLSVILVFGPGGQGKTRLASEFANDSAMEGWAVAQGRHQSDPQPRLP
ncbi:MAG: ATP-binding protein, partial [Streptosporangiaceae bacterium]